MNKTIHFNAFDKIALAISIPVYDLPLPAPLETRHVKAT